MPSQPPYTAEHKPSRFGDVCRIALDSQALGQITADQILATLQERPYQSLELVFDCGEDILNSGFAQGFRTLKENVLEPLFSDKSLKWRYHNLESIQCVFKTQDEPKRELMDGLSKCITPICGQNGANMPRLRGVDLSIAVDFGKDGQKVFASSAIHAAYPTWFAWFKRLMMPSLAHIKTLFPKNMFSSFSLDALKPKITPWLVVGGLIALVLWWFAIVSPFVASMIFTAASQMEQIIAMLPKLTHVIPELLTLLPFIVFVVWRLNALRLVWSARLIPFPVLVVFGLILAVLLGVQYTFYGMPITMHLLPSVFYTAALMSQNILAPLFTLAYFAIHHFTDSAFNLKSYATMLHNTPLAFLMAFSSFTVAAKFSWPLIGLFSPALAPLAYVLISAAIGVGCYLGLGAWGKHLDQKHHDLLKDATLGEGQGKAATQMAWQSVLWTLLAPFRPSYWNNNTAFDQAYVKGCQEASLNMKSDDGVVQVQQAPNKTKASGSDEPAKGPQV